MSNVKTDILIVNDELDIRDLLYDVLTEAGYNVATVKNGYEAVEMVKEKDFSIIFMDIMMPGINGLETYKAIRKTGSRTEVVLMTGNPYQARKLVDEAMRLGVHCCLRKPFPLIKAIDTVKEILAKS